MASVMVCATVLNRLLPKSGKLMSLNRRRPVLLLLLRNRRYGRGWTPVSTFGKEIVGHGGERVEGFGQRFPGGGPAEKNCFTLANRFDLLHWQAEHLGEPVGLAGAGFCNFNDRRTSTPGR